MNETDKEQMQAALENRVRETSTGLAQVNGCIDLALSLARKYADPADQWRVVRKCLERVREIVRPKTGTLDAALSPWND